MRLKIMEMSFLALKSYSPRQRAHEVKKCTKEEIFRTSLNWGLSTLPYYEIWRISAKWCDVNEPEKSKHMHTSLVWENKQHSPGEDCTVLEDTTDELLPGMAGSRDWTLKNPKPMIYMKCRAEKGFHLYLYSF